MALSVTEKQQLREIVKRRIGRRIEELEAQHKPELEALGAEIKASVFEQLGIAVEYAALLALREQAKQLAKDIQTAQDEIAAKLGIRYSALATASAIDNEIASQQKRLFKLAKEAAPFYADVMALEAEMQRLDEFIWIATSNKQVSELFQILNGLLSEGPTKLEQAAQDIEKE